MAVAPTSQNDPRAQKGASGATKNNAVLPKDGDEGTASWFAKQVLERIGAPTSGTNIQAMVSWMAAEGGNWNNSAKYNPLNTTLAMKGDAGTMNSVGVRKYSSWAQGIDATAQTLLGGKGRYSGIINAFKNESPPAQIYQAVTSSPWGTHKIGNVSSGSYGVTPTAGAKSDGTWDVPATSAAGTAGYSEDDLASTFGFSSAFFGTDPSLKALLNRAISEQWYASDSGLALFKSALKGTSWFQNHSASAREWIQLQTSDPTEMKHQISQKTADLQAQATQLGLSIPSARLSTIATNILKYGLDATQEQEALAAEMKYQKKWDGNGMAGQLQDQLQKAAGDYGYTLDNQSAFKAVQSILLNQKNSDFYLDQMKQAAKVKHPGMAKLIDQGMSVRDIAQPYLQSMQNVLEIDPANIDLTKDKTLQQAFSYKDPNAKSTKGDVDPSLMPTWQFEQTLRQDPRWMQTDNAQKSFMDTGVSVLRNMGLMT